MIGEIYRGETQVGEFELYPYSYQIDSGHERAKQILEQGPPEEITMGGETPEGVEDGPNVLVDDARKATEEEAFKFIEQTLFSLGYSVEQIDLSFDFHEGADWRQETRGQDNGGDE